MPSTSPAPSDLEVRTRIVFHPISAVIEELAISVLRSKGYIEVRGHTIERPPLSYVRRRSAICWYESPEEE